MGNQNNIGLKYCCRHKPKLKMNMDERGYQVSCYKCGDTVDGFAGSTEAINSWNIKKENIKSKESDA